MRMLIGKPENQEGQRRKSHALREHQKKSVKKFNYMNFVFLITGKPSLQMNHLIKEDLNGLTWASIYNYTHILATMLKEHSVVGWKPKNAFERISLTLHKKIKLNLLATIHIIPLVRKNPEFFYHSLFYTVQSYLTLLYIDT
jgi:hypothetical protein